MYDTVAALWRPPDGRVLADIPWSVTRAVKGDEGVSRVTLQGGERGGITVIGHPDGTVKVERSLPKALTGQNVEEISQADVPAALAAVDAELHAFAPEVDFPPLATWDPCKVDYVRNFDLRDQSAVEHALEKLSTVQLPRKGRPVTGESGSVAWPVGLYRPKFYNKGRETGMLRYLNRLRYEVGAFGGRALGRIPGLVEVGSGGRLTVADVLVPEACEFVLARYMADFGGWEMTAREIENADLWRAMVGFFGPRRSYVLLGMFVGWHLSGVRTWQELEKLALGERTAWFRARADLKRFRDAVLASGEWGEIDGSIDELQVRIARMGLAA